MNLLTLQQMPWLDDCLIGNHMQRDCFNKLLPVFVPNRELSKVSLFMLCLSTCMARRLYRIYIAVAETYS